MEDMPPRLEIHNPEEISEFVRTHLGHRLTAMVAPLCIPQEFWHKRNDAYRAAKEGSYSMLRMFIEFLGVKSVGPSTVGATPRLVEATGHHDDDVQIDAFRIAKVPPCDFGENQVLIAKAHRSLCKINAHFSYDRTAPDVYDRIASPDDEDEWRRAVDVVVQMLDDRFYRGVGMAIVVHFDLERPFTEHYKSRLGLRSNVKGDGLGRPGQPERDQG
jgi:hypothetical protein